jgi:hypothetical protein
MCLHFCLACVYVVLFWHSEANSHRRRKCIRMLEHDGQAVVTVHQKVEALFEFYDKILGEPSPHCRTINLELLDIPRLDLSDLEARFTEEEVLQVIRSLSPDKAPGLDGFTA